MPSGMILYLHVDIIHHIQRSDDAEYMGILEDERELIAAVRRKFQRTVTV